jgi:prophage regulatory protein
MKAKSQKSPRITPFANVAELRLDATALVDQKRLRIDSVRETASRLNIGRSTLYDWLDEKSPNYKPALPKPIHLGKNTGFIEHEIDDFIRGLMQARGGGVGN